MFECMRSGVKINASFKGALYHVWHAFIEPEWFACNWAWYACSDNIVARLISDRDKNIEISAPNEHCEAVNNIVWLECA